MKNALDTYTTFIEQQSTDYAQAAALCRSKVAAIDPAKDLQDFLEINQTRSKPAPFVEYESYKGV